MLNIEKKKKFDKKSNRFRRIIIGFTMGFIIPFLFFRDANPVFRILVSFTGGAFGIIGGFFYTIEKESEGERIEALEWWQWTLLGLSLIAVLLLFTLLLRIFL